MRKLFSYAVAGAMGAVAAYLFDPESGRRRRAIMRDRAGGYVRKTQHEAERKTRYYSGKAEGVRHEFFGPTVAQVPPDDITLAHKIESEVLRHYDSSRVNVNVENGVAVLRGQLSRPDEIRALVHDVERVPGVRNVRSLLHTPS